MQCCAGASSFNPRKRRSNRSAVWRTVVSLEPQGPSLGGSVDKIHCQISVGPSLANGEDPAHRRLMVTTADMPVDLDWHQLPEEEIQHFDDNGYLVVRDVLDRPMIDRVTAAAERHIASDRQENRIASKGGLNDGFRNCVALDDDFIPLLTHPKALSVIVQLLGAHVQLMTSHIIYKYPDPPSESGAAKTQGWHRDYGAATKIYGNHVPRIMVKCAFYLNDLMEPNSGATLVVPGSNHNTNPTKVAEGEFGPPGYVEPKLRAGDCLLFENRVVHASGPNLTQRTRKAVMFGYGFRWIMPIDFRQQDTALLEKLDLPGRYLVGERYPPSVDYTPGGGDSPLAPWCERYGAPAVRPV